MFLYMYIYVSIYVCVYIYIYKYHIDIGIPPISNTYYYIAVFLLFLLVTPFYKSEKLSSHYPQYTYLCAQSTCTNPDYCEKLIQARIIDGI